MPIVIQDKTIYATQFDDWDFVVQYFQPDGITPLDLTGWTFKFAIFRDESKLIECTSGAGITVNLVTAAVAISISHTLTGIEAGDFYRYYFQQTDAGGKVKKPLSGEPFQVKEGQLL